MALSNAERQRAYRERRRGESNDASNGVTVVTPALKPREETVVNAIIAGASTAAALRMGGFNGESGYMRDRLKPGGDLASALAERMEKHRLSADRILRKVSRKMEATRLFNAAKGRDADGNSVTECIVAQDNDAQLRATEIALDLAERAGTIPSASQGPAGGGGGVHYHLHLDRLAALPAPQHLVDAGDNGQRAIDVTPASGVDTSS